MDPQNIVSLLQPLREPAAISWWPPAPGWWLLLAALLLTGAFLARVFWRRHRRRAPLRAARRELAAVRAATADPASTATALATLLRRVALATDGAEARDRAAVTGGAWVSYLNMLAATPQPIFDDEFAALPYRPAPAADAAQRALDDCERWLDAVERRL